MRGLFVTGTDTGSGKTAVAAAVLATLREHGSRVAALKPVVTGLDDAPDPHWRADHEVLARAAGSSPELVAPYRFGPAFSPHLAAELAGSALALPSLLEAAREASIGVDALIVEGVGGLLVPLTPQDSVRDLAVSLGLPVLIAARPGLGTINHTLLTLEAARSAGLRVAAVVLTPWLPEPGLIERSNRATIERLGEVEVAALPRLRDVSPPELAAAGAALRPERWL